MTIRWIIFKLLDKSTDHATQTEMIRVIRAMGHDIRLRCGYRDKEKYFGLAPEAIRYFRLPRIRKVRAIFFAAAVMKEVFRILYLERPDILLLDYSVNLLAAPLLWAGRILRVRTKVVLDVRTLPVDVRTFRLGIRLFFLSLRLGGRYCDGITFITEAMRRYCIEHTSVDRLKTSIWTSGVNASLFDPGRFDQIPSGPDFQLLYHGGLSLSRGIGSLILAVRHVRERGCPAVLTLIGNCVDREALLRIIRENGLEEFCRIRPAISYEQVPRLINACDLAVIPFPNFIGWRVSSPIKLLENMAMGKSLVITDIEAHREVLGNCECAFYAKDDRPESIAEAIWRAYIRRGELRTRGGKARSMALDGYTWEKQARRLTSFFETI